MKEANVLDYLKLRVLSFYQEAKMIKAGKFPRPRMAILYPTYVCNHSCIGCDYSINNETNKSLTSDEFDRLIEQLVKIGISSVEFCGGGEPTLHPYLLKAIDKFIQNKIAIGLLTNGTNMNDGLKKALVEHGAYCRISVEAGSEEVFNQYKRPKSGTASFSNVINNIESLVGLRNSYGEDTNLQISYKYSIDNNNYKDVFNAVVLAKRLKVDSIQFKMIRNMETEIKDRETIEWLKIEFEKIKKETKGIIIMDDLRKTELTKCRCWLSMFQLTIDAVGDVYICCYYRHRMEKHRLGNLLKSDLEEIWYSQEHWHKVSQIDVEDCNKYDCRFHYYNELMHDLVIKDKGQLSFI